MLWTEALNCAPDVFCPLADGCTAFWLAARKLASILSNMLVAFPKIGNDEQANLPFLNLVKNLYSFPLDFLFVHDDAAYLSKLLLDDFSCDEMVSR